MIPVFPSRQKFGFGAPLTIGCVGFKIGRDGPFPFVTIRKKLRLVIKQLFAGFGGVFKVWSLDDRIDRAGLLAETAINAFRHVDVVARGAAAAVLARLALDRDRLSGAHSLAKLARDTPLFAIRIAAQRMLTAKTRAKR